MTDLQQGKLEQACPCGRWEAAGSYCTNCLRPMGPADWYRNGDAERRAAFKRAELARIDDLQEAAIVASQNAPQNPTTPLKRGPGSPRKEMAA